jgi:hypothetical protein
VECEGVVCHVRSRGCRREAIFKDNQDQALFFETLGQACLKGAILEK